jgi:hypothetical protein
MFKLIGWIIKSTLVAILIIAASHWIRVRGKTVSDQVKTQMAQVEKAETTQAVKTWAEETIPPLLVDAKKGTQRLTQTVGQLASDVKKGTEKKSVEKNRENASNETISDSERKKLRLLLEDINSSRQQARSK